MRAILAALILISVIIPATAETSPAAPTNVIAFAMGPVGVAVKWSPPPAGADTYRVYGIADNDAWELLDETGLSASVVAAGFDAYAVVSVIGGVESQAAYAFGAACVYVGTQHPYVYYKTNCTAWTGFVVHAHPP